MRKESGQSLLIAVLITSLLFLAIPVIVYMTINRTTHRMAATKRDQATATAELGIEYAKRLLSDPANTAVVWARPIVAANLAPINDCNSNLDVVAADGSHFRLTCNVPGVACPQCAPYQIQVRAVTYVPDPDGIKGADPSRDVPYKAIRAVEAYFSQKTLVATLANGVVAPAALEMGAPPLAAEGGRLYVYNGSIVNYDPLSTWTVRDYDDLCRSPRKFSRGPIQGTTWDGVSVPINTPTYPRAPLPTDIKTDRKEYWANMAVGFPMDIDVQTAGNAYELAAKASVACPIVPTCNPVGNCGPAPVGCFFDNAAAGGTYIFDDPGNFASQAAPYPQPGGYTFNDPTRAFYVTGNAIFRHVSMIGPVIVKGNLTLEQNRDAAVAPIPGPYNIAVPVPQGCNAAIDEFDHPYPAPAALPVALTAGCPAPCKSLSYGYMDIQGFVYVGGNLIVDPANNPSVGSGNWWGINGAVRVDGKLTLTSGTLEIAYNADIHRQIRTINFELMKDKQLEVPVQ